VHDQPTPKDANAPAAAASSSTGAGPSIRKRTLAAWDKATSDISMARDHNTNNHVEKENQSPAMLKAVGNRPIPQVPNSRSNNNLDTIGNEKKRDEQAAIACRYDGHCPVGRTCAVAASLSRDHDNNLPGTCLEIPIDHQHEPTQVCLEACRRELEMDEHFFHEKWPHVLAHDATTSTRGRPGGCILYYQRTPDRLTETSIPAWEALRFRHIVRVDPLAEPKDDDSEDTTWMVYCTEPCHTDQDCQPKNPPLSSSAAEVTKQPFVCQQGACQRNSAFWEAMTVPQQQEQHDKQGGEMVIVTGATKAYFTGLQNLMGSIRYWAPHCKVVVYNLGELGSGEKDWIQQQPNLLSLEWPDGVPDTYPAHVVRKRT
jgi:hypothetical protein